MMIIPQDVHNALWNWAEQLGRGADELIRPSYLYKPRLFIDGNEWCALYGTDLQAGVSGFGKSPDAAYKDFDKAWRKEKTDA